MKRYEYEAGLTWLHLMIPDFEPDEQRRDAWFEELKTLPAPVWRGCLKLISREVDQFWKKNLVSLVHARYRKVVTELCRQQQAKVERAALPPRMPEKEYREGIKALKEKVGLKEMP